MNLKSYSDISYYNEELKSLTRYRFHKVRERAELKSSVSRLVTILFPELETLFLKLHMASVYALLSEFPGTSCIASAPLAKLSIYFPQHQKVSPIKKLPSFFVKLLKPSIGSVMPVKSLELNHTIKLIREFTSEIDEIESEIKPIMDEIQSLILTLPRIGYRMVQ